MRFKVAQKLFTILQSFPPHKRVKQDSTTILTFMVFLLQMNQFEEKKQSKIRVRISNVT